MLASHIDPKVVKPDEVEILQDLILVALRNAADTMRETVKEVLGPLAGPLARQRRSRPLFEGPRPGSDRRTRQLPGIGPKSAQRIAFHLISVEAPEIDRLTAVLSRVRGRISSARSAETSPDAERCRICGDARRDGSMVCVVEEPKDVRAVERPGSAALYHVLVARWIRYPASDPISCEFASCSTGSVNGSTAWTSPR